MRLLFLLGLACLVQCHSSSPEPISIQHCSQVTSQDACDYHTYGSEHCAWQSNQCVQITQCPDITSRQICDSSPPLLDGCVWDPSSNSCVKPTATSCLAHTDTVSCDKATSCTWVIDQGIGICQLVTTCNQITDSTECNNFNSGTLSCYWSSTNSQCRQINSCSDAPLEECAQHSYWVNGARQYCRWEVSKNICMMMNQCTDANSPPPPTANQENCQYIEQVFSCQYDNGLCSSYLTCNDALSEAICQQPSPPPPNELHGCWWDPKALSQKKCVGNATQCADILSSTTCSNPKTNPKQTTSLNCTWTAQNTCVPSSGVTCTQLGSENCTSQLLGVNCQWCNGSCAPFTTCQNATCQSTCASISSTAGINFCTFDKSALPFPGKCALTKPAGCSDFIDKTSCQTSKNTWQEKPLSTNCFWTTSTSTCAPITDCSLAQTQETCNMHSYGGSSCQWCNGACSDIVGSGCARFTCSDSCTAGQCSWYVWNQVTREIAVPNGAPAGSSCGISSPTTCNQIVAPDNITSPSINSSNSCAAASFDNKPCYWPSNTPLACVTDERSCSVIVDCSTYNSPADCATAGSSNCHYDNGTCCYGPQSDICVHTNPCSSLSRTSCISNDLCHWR